MPDFKTENLNWLDNLASVETKLQGNLTLTNDKLAKILNLSPSLIGYLRALKTCFDPAAIEKVRLAAKSDPPFILSYNSAKALARLVPRRRRSKAQEGNVADLRTVHDALDVTLSRQLTPKQIDDLVEWVKSGNPPSEFDPKDKSSKAPKTIQPKSVSTPPAQVDGKLAQLFKQAEESTGEDKIKAQNQVVAYVASLSPSLKKASEIQETKEEAPVKTAQVKKSQSGTPSLLLEWAAGISIFSKLKSKIKKGQPLTPGDWCLLFLENIGQGLRWLVKHPLKWVHETFKFVWKIIIDALKALGIYKFVQSVVTLALVALLLLAAWDMRQHGFWHPINIVRYKFFSHTTAEASPAMVPTPVAVTSTNKPENKKQTQPPARISHPSVIAFVEGSDAQETKPYLDQELAGIPPNSVIKAFVFQPDFAMSSDMAYRRLTDLQDKKYSVRWGNDQVSVVTINPTASNLILKVQSGLDSLLTGPSKADFYWEDVKQLHCDEIKTTINGKPAKDFYQVSLFLAENKKPITIQCATAADLTHLVSALEFYLKLSRGTAAPLTALPYLNQGLRLNNNSVVTTLWADSPIAKAGLVLSDYVWSMEKNTDHQQSKTELETALQNLTPGTHLLYKVTDDGWKKALANKVADDPDSFRPLRRKVSLSVE